MSRLTSGAVRSTSWTCRSQLLPKMVTTGVSARSRAARVGSVSAVKSGRRVLPNAATRACPSRRWRISSKKAMSLGLESGQPPSM